MVTRHAVAARTPGAEATPAHLPLHVTSPKAGGTVPRASRTGAPTAPTMRGPDMTHITKTRKRVIGVTPAIADPAIWV